MTFLLLSLAGMLILVFALMGPCLKNGFSNWDDPTYIENNPLIREFSGENVKRIFTEVYFSNYQPLHIFSYLIEYHFFKMDPHGYHMVSLVMHAVVSVLAMWFVLVFTGSRLVSIFTGVLFAIHPMHVESVAWVAERKDLLYAGFFFASVTAYIKYLQLEKRSLLVWAFVWFVFAIFSKAMAASLPPVLVLTDIYYRRKLNMKLILEKLPFFLLAFIMGGISVYASARDNSINSSTVYSFFDRIILAHSNLLLYAGKLIAPLHLSGYYPYPDKVNGMLPVYYYATPPIVFALVGIVIWSLKHTRMVFYCTGFYFLTLLLVLQLLPVGPNVFTERYSYIPSVPFFMMIGYGLDRLLHHGKITSAMKYGAYTIIIVYGIWLCTITPDRCRVWKDPETYWTDVISKFESVPIAYNNRGHYYNKTGRKQEAMSDFNQALRLNAAYDMALFNRGSLYGEMGKLNEALNDLSNAIRINHRLPEAYKMRGQVYAMTGKGDSAIADFNQALKLQPVYPEIDFNLGIFAFNKGQQEEACTHFKKAASQGYDKAKEMVGKYCK